MYPSVQTDDAINPYNHGVVGQLEQECVGKDLERKKQFFLSVNKLYVSGQPYSSIHL